MQRLTLVIASLALCLTVAQGQSLADVIPADTLLYAKLVDPIGDFEKLSGSGDVWARPDKVSSKSRSATEKSLKRVDESIGVQGGTMDSWTRAIGSIEIALFSFEFDSESFTGGGAPPTLDFAAILESPLAIEMYNQFSGMLIDSGAGTRNERGDIVIDTGGEQQPLFSVQGTRMILAGNEDRLNKVVAAFKQGRDVNPLSASANFKAVCGASKGARVVYGRMGPILRFISEKLDDSARGSMDNILKPLGMYDIDSVGYYEDGPNGVITMKGDKDVNLFKLLKGGTATPALQGLLPEDTAFALGHAANFAEHYGRIEGFLVDPATFPFAMFVSGGLTGLVMQAGLSPKAITESIKEGFAAALVPDENGDIQPQNALVILTKVPDRAEAEKLLDRVGRSYGKGKGITYTKVEEGGILWMKPADPKAATSQPAPSEGATSQPATTPPAEPPARSSTPTQGETDGGPERITIGVSIGNEGGLRTEVVRATDDAPQDAESRPRNFRGRRNTQRAISEADRNVLGAYVNGYVIMGKTVPVKKVIASVTGKAPTLAAAGAYARLPQQATFFVNLGLKSIFKSIPDFAGAFSLLKGTQSIGIAAVATDTTVTITSNRASGQLWGIFAAAGMAGEQDRGDRTAIVDALRDIGKRTTDYAAAKKAWPKSLADLGYPADKPLVFADSEGKMKPIVFLPPKGPADKPDSAFGTNGQRVLLAYWDSMDMGRLCVSLDGGAWGWSESEFIGALRRYNGN